MESPALCKKHFYQVAGYFDKQVAFQFEIDGDSCMICNKQIFLEGARRFTEQHQQPAPTHNVARAAE